ncbi:hypothetical protein PG990_002503 [Apiospora arundinis]
MPRFSSRTSSVSTYDDIDAITPCPLPAPTTSKTAPSSNPPASLSTASSYITVSNSHNHNDEADELRQSSRRSSSGSNSSHHHRRILGMAFHSNKSRSPSPTSSLSLSEAACEEDLDAFASRRRDSVRALEQGAGGDPEQLWRRMLELQQVYGCYNSARMSAALESGDASLLRPSKACLNLLNENMVLLPDDADYMLRDHNAAAAASGHPTSH